MTQNNNTIKLPLLISNGMVLQRNAQVKIWGLAPAGKEILLHFLDKVYKTTVDTNGEWQIILCTEKEGGPYDMVIEIDESNERITIEDILLGDVWLCSGQSNMEVGMDTVRDTYPDVIAEVYNDTIRQFKIPVKYDFEKPQKDFEGGSWVAVNPQSILGFTAVGYFFASSLHEKYHIPIGIINASLGGSPAQAWLSEEALLSFPEYLEDAYRFRDKNYVEEILEKDQITLEEWNRNINESDVGMSDKDIPAFHPAYDASKWESITLPSFWEDEGLGNFNGAVWFRREINIDFLPQDIPIKLFLGNIVDEDTVYLNGTMIGTLPMQYIPRKYDIPEGLLVEGKNTLVVRVVNFSGKGGFIKEKPYYFAIGDRVVDLCGDWQYLIGAKSEPLPAPAFVQWRPLGLYNGMIAPSIRYAIKGAIWYQGESNTGKPEEYDLLLKALIEDWRAKWKLGDFPFLIVQLPNFMEASDIPQESQWAELREAQRRTLDIANTGMAVTIDLGEWNDIHPANKKDVGKRLALIAQKVAYGDSVIVSAGPMLHSTIREGNSIKLSFCEIGSGLIAKDADELGYFAIAAADEKYLWAKAYIEDDCVIVRNEQLCNPIYVRYAWADNPKGANLYNKEGLPASPFTARIQNGR